jgi:hypothetical protein
MKPTALHSRKSKLVIPKLIITFLVLSFLSTNAIAKTEVIKGSSVNDSFRIWKVGNVIRYSVNSVLFTVNDADQIIVDAGGGDDLLTVDFNGGNPIPVRGLTYNGEGNITPEGDVLSIEGNGVNSSEYVFHNETDGAITVDGRVLTYTGLEPIIDTVAASSLTVNGTSGNNTISILNGTSADQILVQVDAFETIEFKNKTSLVINALGGADTININFTQLATGLSNIIVNGADGTDIFNIIDVHNSPTLNLNGEGQADSFVIGDGKSVTGTIDGGADSDSIDWSAYTTPVVANFQTGVATATGGITNVEIATGGSAGDTFTMQSSATVAYIMNGGNPVSPPGDTLNFDPNGLAINWGAALLPNGSISSGANLPVTYTGIETLIPSRPSSIPVLSFWGFALLTFLLGIFGFRHRRIK